MLDDTLLPICVAALLYGSIIIKSPFADSSCVDSTYSLREAKLWLDYVTFVEITCGDEDVMSAYIEGCKFLPKLGL